ncbi:methyl-accepting chemotaxis protein [Roseateles cavernae]|uniref:methyl-accepting chemotaxis protein n=1 Tax=Roseateles cavernae TaxID=3153578 RepID=UPI0032E44986
MRINEPVTQREFEFPADATLMSTTDPQSQITYANAAFAAVSGFTSEELRGQPHNLVRHPDMPIEAFADMWRTLKAGLPWTGLVKNRRKCGDHYWVRANAAPVVRGGRTVGYISVRTKPSRDEVNSAQALYADLRQGRGRGRGLHQGVLVHGGVWAWTSWLKTMPVRWRIRGVMMVLLPGLVGAAVMVGMAGESLGGFAALSAALLSLGSWLLECQIARPLEHVQRQALRVATGESQEVAPLDRVDEIGMTMRTINQLGLMFRWLTDDVSQQVLTVQSAVSEIARGNMDLGSRTEQAAASVQQTASSMEQMTSSVTNNAETATQVSRLSRSASDAAERGGQVVSEVVAIMHEITKASNRIADIIGVIDGVAFQTNILALNAAVEAARAGEQGLGFAVVAGEVRNLAGRCTQAAKEIKVLIGASTDKVDAGSRMADEAGVTMERIVEQVKRVSDLIAEISKATTEQSAGISQVGQAVSHLDEITQQNAALVEQGAAASQSLEQQTARLVEAVSVFRR